MLLCLIYFFVPFSVNYILRNYVIPQAMPHAIPHTLIPPFTLSDTKPENPNTETALF